MKCVCHTQLAIPLILLFAAPVVPTVMAIGGCQKVTLPHEVPGPAGCGRLDPRDTAPSRLSVAQQKIYRENGSPDEVEDGPGGPKEGRIWVYHRSAGSQFGESQTVVTYSFGINGLLKGSKTDVLRKVGK